MCSQIGMPAPSRMVCAGRARSAMSSMFTESMPTKATPERHEQLASFRSQERIVPAVALRAPMLAEVGSHEHRGAAQVGVFEDFWTQGAAE